MFSHKPLKTRIHILLFVTNMGRLDVEVEDRLEQRLRMAVLKRYGGRKGDLKKAVVDAIEKWLREEAKDE